MPKVSIIVPVYKSEQTLTRCVNSLLAQDYEDMDILLVDNHSTDGTIEYMNEINK